MAHAREARGGAPVARTTRALEGAVLDLDGVVTRTARVHFAAWKQLFDELLARRAPRTGEDHRPFDAADYRAHVDGRPRLDGVRAFLSSRGIALPEESADPRSDSIAALGARKDTLFRERLARDGVEVDEDAVRLARALRAAGVRVGLATASRNAASVLARAGLSELFDARVDGVVSAQLGLRGKPHPDTILECLCRLGVAPASAILVEDAGAGVAAGRAAGVALVVGVDRGEGARLLREAGADRIVTDLGALTVDALDREVARAIARAVVSDGWVLAYDGLDPAQEGLREALCTLGNGVFATRGAAEESRANGTSYPGTYVAGGYDALASEVAGRSVVNEDLVNVPSWLWLTFQGPDGEWLDLFARPPLEYRQELDLREGVLRRRFRTMDAAGRITAIESRRLVHMGEPSLAAIEWRLTPENWSGPIVLRSGLDGAVENDGVARYRQLSKRHLELCARAPVAPAGIYLKARTVQSRIEIALAARTRLFVGDALTTGERRIRMDEPARIVEETTIEVRAGETLRVEKVVALVSSREPGIGEAGAAARRRMAAAPDFAALHRTHVEAWARLWRRCDLEVDVADGADDDEAPVHAQLVLRLHVFHLLATASPHTAGRDVGLPARGLHGEAYRGHVFWDELFILPFFVQRLPELARSIILYRYHRLDAARALAREAGAVGAAYPWQSAGDGYEATQEVHLNPLSGRWDPDFSHLQRHVNVAIVYNLWRYYEATGDRPFLEAYGAEIILEIARFWSSIATRSATTGRYEITGVMGPDEYHEQYPGAEAGGVRNNAYTNVTAVWCLLRARDVLDAISRERRDELLRMLDIDDAELARWDDIGRRMTICFHDGLISQFEGYEALEELDWDAYARRYGNIERLDRILRAEGRSPDRYKVSKQADVVMLLYLFSAEELIELVRRLGYDFDDAALRRSVRYYQARTSHGSTLSKVVFTSAVHREDCEAGCRIFLAALRSDLYDVQGGTTAEGIHLGAMAGTIDIVTRYYAGVSLRRDGVHLCPDMPRRLRRVRFRVQHEARWLDVELTRERLRVSVDDAEPTAVTVWVKGRAHALGPGESLEVDIEPHAETSRRPPLDEERTDLRAASTTEKRARMFDPPPSGRG